MDADVYDGERPVSAADAARFSVKGLGWGLGLGLALALVIGRMWASETLWQWPNGVLGCVSEGIPRADELWGMVEAKGDFAVLMIGFGPMEQASLSALPLKMESVCKHGNPGARFEMGQDLEPSRSN